MKRRFILGFILLAMTTINAAENKAATGLSFLEIGVDARAVGMGEAYTAVAGDASATYWNPAGLMQSPASNVLFNHNEWLLDIRGEFASLAVLRQHSAWGLHVRSFNIADIEIRDIPSVDPLEKTSAHYLSAGLSYARAVSRNFDLGVTVKYLFEKIYIESASGYALDFGAVYRTPLPGLKLAAAVQNLGKMKDLQKEQTVLPRIIRAGLSYGLPLNFPQVSALLAADVVIPQEDNTRFQVGGELLLWQQIAVRGGFLTGYDSRNYSLGLGFRRSAIRLDYAITPFSDALGTTHRFTVNFDI